MSCSHRFTVLPADVHRRVSQITEEHSDGYAGRIVQPWCVSCGERITMAEYDRRQRNRELRAFAFIAVTVLAVLAGIGFLIQHFSGASLNDMALGACLLLAAGCLAALPSALAQGD